MALVRACRLSAAGVLQLARNRSLGAGGRIKLHTTWDDGSELIEEFDANTDELLVRRIRRKTAVGSVGEWEWLAGDQSSLSDVLTF